MISPHDLAYNFLCKTAFNAIVITFAHLFVIKTKFRKHCLKDII